MPDKTDKPAKLTAGFAEDIQNRILKELDEEYTASSSNMKNLLSKSDEYYQMIHCVRGGKGKQFEDEPDIFLPEYTERLLTQIGNFVSQFFSSRDYVDVYLESKDPLDIAESKASKKLLNIILNMPETYYFQKVVRMLMTANPKGYAVIKGGYAQKSERQFKGYNEKQQYRMDEDGNLLDEMDMVVTDTMFQSPAIETIQEEIWEDVVVEDYPTFDVYPNRDVRFSPEYCYSLKDKKYVIFSDDKKTLSELETDADKFGYFNLEILKEKSKQEQKVQNQDGKEIIQYTYPAYKIRERWGKQWVKVKERDENDKPSKIEPGIEFDGTKKKGAELIECIVTDATWNLSKDAKGEILIRFQASPHSERPMCWFICYMDELKDTGFGDGEATLELQSAINDTSNLGFYRTMLATKPAFKGKAWANMPDKIKFHSEEIIKLDDINDLQEFVIQDNTQGYISSYGMLSTGMDRIMATFPNTMGGSTDRRETATVGSIMDQRASIRQSLKNMSYEMIGFASLYNMLLSLCNDFMLPETLISLVGQEMAYTYNPKRKDRFKPVTQALETEYGKQFKIKLWQNVYGQTAAIPNPKTPMVLNYIFGQILELLGGDFNAFKEFMFEEDPNKTLQWLTITGNKGIGTLITPQNPNPTQNQQGLPQGGAEQMARGQTMQPGAM